MCNIQGTVVPSLAVVVFANASAASQNIAGLPSAARAARAAAQAGFGECWLTAGPDWSPDEQIRAEVQRLAPAMSVHFLADWVIPADLAGMSAILLAGERLVADSSEQEPADDSLLFDSRLAKAQADAVTGQARLEIGRASCRERVCLAV